MTRIFTVLTLALSLGAVAVVPANAQQYGGYNNYGAPGGSYQQSCSNIQMRGSTLSASCTATNGQQLYSQINVRGCNGDIANFNGHLTCNGYNGNNGSNGYGYNNGNNGNSGNNGWHRHHRDRDRDNDNEDNNNGNNGNGYGYNNRGYGYGNNYGIPPGSYQQSCSNTRMRGSTLSASCTAANGQQIFSSIDVNRCNSSGRSIRNENGYLRC